MRYWHIEGYDGTTKIYNYELPIGYLSESQLQSLLMALSAKAGLTMDEIVGAYARKNSKIHNNHLVVQRDLHPVFRCGENPYFIARVVDSNKLN
jgi:hypothetical protein